MTIKKWLEADYADILGLINEVEAEWKAAGSKQRRNWWDVLAGNQDGTPSVIAGREFPILRTARERKGWDPAPNAICNNENEEAAPLRFGRWQKKQLPKIKRAMSRATKVKRLRPKAQAS